MTPSIYFLEFLSGPRITLPLLHKRFTFSYKYYSFLPLSLNTNEYREFSSLHFSFTISLIKSPQNLKMATSKVLLASVFLSLLVLHQVHAVQNNLAYFSYCDIAANSLGMLFLAMFQRFTSLSNLGNYRVFLIMGMLWTPIQSYAYKNIFLLAGQSNMSGRGGVINGNWTGYIPPECRSQPSVLRLSAGLTWEVASEPLHRDMDKKTCGVGPGMSFANYVLEKDSNMGVIGLVPCAYGGTSISEWRQGSYFYDRLVKRSKAALEDGGEIRALLWYQGESDTKKEEDAELYKKRIEVFFNTVRTDLSLPNLPIIQVALASGIGAYFDIVREAQLAIKLPNVTTVDAKGLQLLNDDPVHLSTPGQVSLGKMMADAFLHFD